MLLCYIILYYVILGYIMLYYVILCYIILQLLLLTLQFYSYNYDHAPPPLPPSTYLRFLRINLFLLEDVKFSINKIFSVQYAYQVCE